MSAPVKLTAVQRYALEMAAKWGEVRIYSRFGNRVAHHPHEIASSTYRVLASLGLLTPHEDGSPNQSGFLSIYAGKPGYLTIAGRAALEGAKP